MMSFTDASSACAFLMGSFGGESVNCFCKTKQNSLSTSSLYQPDPRRTMSLAMSPSYDAIPYAGASEISSSL